MANQLTESERFDLREELGRLDAQAAEITRARERIEAQLGAATSRTRASSSSTTPAGAAPAAPAPEPAPATPQLGAANTIHESASSASSSAPIQPLAPVPQLAAGAQAPVPTGDVARGNSDFEKNIKSIKKRLADIKNGPTSLDEVVFFTLTNIITTDWLELRHVGSSRQLLRVVFAVFLSSETDLLDKMASRPDHIWPSSAEPSDIMKEIGAAFADLLGQLSPDRYAVGRARTTPNERPAYKSLVAIASKQGHSTSPTRSLRATITVAKVLQAVWGDIKEVYLTALAEGRDSVAVLAREGAMPPGEAEHLLFKWHSASPVSSTSEVVNRLQSIVDRCEAHLAMAASISPPIYADAVAPPPSIGAVQSASDGPKKKKAQVRCWYCGYYGHAESECHSKRDGRPPRNEHHPDFKKFQVKTDSQEKKYIGVASFTTAPALVVSISVLHGGRSVSLPARIDTGAEANILPLADAERLGWRAADSAACPEARTIAAGGVLDCRGVLRATVVRVGDAIHPSVDWLVVADVEQALIGLPGLEHEPGTGAISWRAPGGTREVRVGPDGAYVAVQQPQRRAGAALSVGAADTIARAIRESAPDVAAKLDELNQRAGNAVAEAMAKIAPVDPTPDVPALSYEEDAGFRAAFDAHFMSHDAISSIEVHGSPEEQTLFRQLIAKHRLSFSDGSFAGGIPPIANVGEHFVRLPVREGAIASKAQLPHLQRRRSPEELKFLNDYGELLAKHGRLQEVATVNGVIVDSFSVAKPPEADGKPRKRRLVHNCAVLKDFHAVSQANIPYLPDVWFDLSRYSHFVEMDATSFYWQFPIALKDSHHFALRIGDKIYRSRISPMGAAGSANHVAGFTGAMLMHVGPNFSTWCYFDNFVVGGVGAAGALAGTEWLLNRIGRDGLSFTLNSTKCRFNLTDINTLGKHIRDNAINPSEQWRRDMLAMPKPSTRKEMGGVMGVVAFNAAHVAAEAGESIRALNAEAARDAGRGPFEWSPTLDEHWRTLLHAAANPMPLHPPRADREWVVLTDAARTYKHGGAAFLCQWSVEDSHLVLIAAHTHTWTTAEQVYSAADAELQMFRVAVKKWRHLLMLVVFTWITDSESMAKRLNAAHLSGEQRITNTAADLSAFSFHVSHAPGKVLQAIDHWSRRHPSEKVATTPPPLSVLERPLKWPITFGAVSVNELARMPNRQWRVDELLETHKIDGLRAAQAADEWCAPLLKAALEADDGTGKAARGPFGYARVLGGVLSVKLHSSHGYRVALPAALVDHVVAAAHESAAHNKRRTEHLVNVLFYAPGLPRRISDFLDACLACQRLSGARALAAIGSHDDAPTAPSRVGEVVYADIYQVLDTNWLTVLDAFSHFLSAYRIPDKSSASVSEQLALHMRSFGAFRLLHTDAGKENLGVVSSFCARNGVTHVPALAEVHTGVGALERAHRTMNDALRRNAAARGVTLSGADVASLMSTVVLTINATPRRPNNVSPHRLVFGHDSSLPPLMMLPATLNDAAAQSPDAAVRELAVNAQLAHDVLDVVHEASLLETPPPPPDARQQQQAHAAAHNAAYQNAGRNTNHTVKVGDIVWLRSTAGHKRSDKIHLFVDDRSGPWRVVAVDVDGNPTRTRVRWCLPLVPAADGQPARFFEQDVDLRRLQPFAVVPVGPDTPSTDTPPLVFRKDDWSADDELRVTSRTIDLVMQSTPPAIRSQLERSLSAAKNAHAQAARALLAQQGRDLRRAQEEQARLAAENDKRISALQEQEREAQRQSQRLKDKALFEFESITGYSERNKLVSGIRRNGNNRPKHERDLSGNERRLLLEFLGKQSQQQAVSAQPPRGGE